MTNPQKAKGDAAEREVAALLADLLGLPVRRKLGAGRQDDQGDLDGIPDTVVQVVNRRDLWAALRLKPPASERQQAASNAARTSTTSTK